jgi:hypothetical protein
VSPAVIVLAAVLVLTLGAMAAAALRRERSADRALRHLTQPRTEVPAMPNDLFAQHASPAAIEAELRKARATRARWDRRVAQLEELHARRTAEVESGAWPPATTPQNGP